MSFTGQEKSAGRSHDSKKTDENSSFRIKFKKIHTHTFTHRHRHTHECVCVCVYTGVYMCMST